MLKLYNDCINLRLPSKRNPSRLRQPKHVAQKKPELHKKNLVYHHRSLIVALSPTPLQPLRYFHLSPFSLLRRLGNHKGKLDNPLYQQLILRHLDLLLLLSPPTYRLRLRPRARKTEPGMEDSHRDHGHHDHRSLKDHKHHLVIRQFPREAALQLGHAVHATGKDRQGRQSERCSR